MENKAYIENKTAWKDVKWIQSDLCGFNASKPDGFFSPIFRGKFVLENIPSLAQLHICCLGLGKVWVNGTEVTSDCLTTPPTRYDKRVLYNTYNITQWLKTGTNTVAVMLGNGSYNDIHRSHFYCVPWRAAPKFICMIVADGCKVLSTDTSWKWTKGPIVYNHSRLGEIYDARLEEEGWKTPEFDDSNWAYALIANPPGGILEANPIETPIRVINEFDMKYIGNGIYDCGRMITGWVKIEVNSQRGAEYKIIYGEKLNESGELDRENLNRYNLHERPRHEDLYFAKGSSPEIYAPTFVFHSFQYVQIICDKQPEKVIAQNLHNDIETVGNFQCNNQMLNGIHEMCRTTFLNNWMNLPLDNCGRSQGPWTGDGGFVASSNLYNFELKTLYKKWLNDFKDCQRDSGQLPGVIPALWPFNEMNGPLWDSALIMIPYYTWLIKDDLSLAQQVWDNILNYMSYLEHMSDDGIVNYGLYDWNSPKTQTDIKLTSTAIFYQDALFVSQMAEALGNLELKLYYENLAQKIKKAYIHNFIKDGELTENTQTAMSMTVYFGLCKEEDKAKIAKALADRVIRDGYHFDCGFQGLSFVTEALSQNGYADICARTLLNDECPGMGYFLKKGLRTLAEDWAGKESQSQSSYGSIDKWFYRYVAGIQFEHDGLYLSPCKLEGITNVIADSNGVKIEIKDNQYFVELHRNAIFQYAGRKKVLSEGQYVFDL